jgi:hypothetical protein
MNGDYKEGKGIVLCTYSFTLSEVNLLIEVLKLKFELEVRIFKKRQKEKPLCWRI